MAIKKGKRTLAAEKEYEEFIARTKETYHEVHCPKHGLLFVRPDLPKQCPVCIPER